MSAAYALKVLARLAPTLRFLHASGWLHGDVKPGNIFLDYSGCAWLGDYGSSVRLAEAARYTGGTPAYQCADIDPAAAPLRFDLAGLAVTLLLQDGVLRLEDAGRHGWPMAALQAALARVQSAPLREGLAALLRE
jgi:serine/threonine protein kinase